MRKVALKQSISHDPSIFGGLTTKLSVAQCTQCRKGQELRPQNWFHQVSSDLLLNLCHDICCLASMSCLTPPMRIICIHPSGCIAQVLADNFDRPFEHLQAQEEINETLPVHPFQQRILDLKSTPPTVLSRQTPYLFLMPGAPLNSTRPCTP